MNKLIKKIVKSEGLNNARVMLPSIYESLMLWGTKEIQQNFLKRMPPPIKYLLFHFWLPSYLMYHRAMLNSLRKGAQKQIIREKETYFESTM